MLYTYVYFKDLQYLGIDEFHTEDFFRAFVRVIWLIFPKEPIFSIELQPNLEPMCQTQNSSI